jgi:hypothetical protein
MPEETVGASEVKEAPGKIVQLPCGIIGKDGKIQREAEITPMLGLTRKAIARDDIRNNPAKVTDVILIQCLRRVGDVRPITNALIGGMLVADRDFLLIEIRRISMSDTINVSTQCGKCNEKIAIKFGLDEIPIRTLKDGAFEIKDGRRCFRIQNDNPKLDAVFRFPEGKDQSLIIPYLEKNPVEGNYRIYAACLLSWDDKPGPFSPNFFDGVPVNVLDLIDEHFNENQPGPEFTQTVPCPVCTADIDMTLQGSDFLFRLPNRGKMS